MDKNMMSAAEALENLAEEAAGNGNSQKWITAQVSAIEAALLAVSPAQPAVSDARAAWTLRQIANLAPDGSAATAIFMAREALALLATPAAPEQKAKPYGYALEQRDGHITFFKEDPKGWRSQNWKGLAKVIDLYDHPAQSEQKAAPSAYERCPHPECGRFQDRAGWGCRAERDGACVKGEHETATLAGMTEADFDDAHGIQPASLTAEQVDRCRKLTLDYAIASFDVAGARMVNTAWVIQRLEELKDLPLDVSVITGGHIALPPVQPAPLPPAMEVPTELFGLARRYAIGWNDCLAAIAASQSTAKDGE